MVSPTPQPQGIQDTLQPVRRLGAEAVRSRVGHRLWDQPRKLKLLYWLTRGNLGTAIALGKATGQFSHQGRCRAQSQAADRLGCWRLRARQLSQGTVEEVDFTDINESISGGALLTGSRWARTVELGRVPTPTNFASGQAQSCRRRSGRDLGRATNNCRIPAPSRISGRTTGSPYSTSPASDCGASSPLSGTRTSLSSVARAIERLDLPQSRHLPNANPGVHVVEDREIRKASVMP